MVHGYHVIFGAYGFWLPNDPRGSWSNFVAAWELLRFGPATKGLERMRLTPELEAARLEAKRALKYPPVQFSGLQARSIGVGFGTAIRKSSFTVSLPVLRLFPPSGEPTWPSWTSSKNN